MENKDYLISHIHDLATRSNDNFIITSTSFLSLSEQSIFLKEYSSLNKEFNNKLIFFLSGGNNEENDRKILFIYPKEMDKEEINKYINKEISLLLITPKNKKYTDKFTHRDFLGSLMNLGIKRDTIGDILIDPQSMDSGTIYVLSSIKNEILNNLTTIKHTTVNIKEIDLSSSPYKLNFEIINIYVSSLRLDNIIKEVFNLSREESKELILKENVFINGESKINPSYILKKDERVSIKGKGKFIFLDESNINKKGRFHTKIKKYS